ncbi:MAG TPA: hypothetical protein VEC06_16545 [Paucimonas sp.]|nr:hypothetical protein [Paucimonas sp.]
MGTALLMAIPVAVAAGFLFVSWRRWRVSQREAYIRSYVFPRGLLERLGEKWPHLNEDQRLLVGKGLRQFFLAHARSGKFVSMPSLAADELWHQFILYTRAYDDFCRKAFGRFMHHTPAVALGQRHQNNRGLRRTWRYVCQQENIDPVDPPVLPLLFALDSLLAIPDGFVYHPQCDKLRQASPGAAVHCGGDFAGSCGGGTGSSGSGADGGGDGGSCGGGGCGGGGD